jgi:hypothetical protein
MGGVEPSRGGRVDLSHPHWGRVAVPLIFFAAIQNDDIQLRLETWRINVPEPERFGYIL